VQASVPTRVVPYCNSFEGVESAMLLALLTVVQRKLNPASAASLALVEVTSGKTAVLALFRRDGKVAVLEEVERLKGIDLASLPQAAPLIFCAAHFGRRGRR
jgi:hypothetical protein